jgi:YHS domain-containing protein
MKLIKHISVIALTASILAGPLISQAADTKSEVKPYKLEKCIVSDEKLGEMGKPFVFDYKGQEVKLCCKSCKKDFDKDPAKYMKKLSDAEKKSGNDAKN